MRRGRSRAGAGLSDRETMLLLIPALLPIVILSVIPLVRGIYLGFTDARAGLEVTTNFIGLDNFRALLDDDLFVNSFKIGLIWSVAVTAIGFCFALGLALLLSQDLHGRWLARSLALVPWAMPAVVVGIMWKLFFQPQAGILNEILRRAHLPGETTDWLSSFTWALPAVILVGVWAGMPQTTIALLAGLQSIQDDLHEAAAVDGATAWQRFRTITLPQLRPVIIAITTLDFIWNFNSFGLVYVLTEGGPAGKTQLPMLFAYSQAFEYGEFGYASALGSAMVVVIACVLVFYLWGRLKETQVIVTTRPKRAKSVQYVGALRLRRLPRLPAPLDAVDVVQGAARARPALPLLHPGRHHVRELPDRADRGGPPAHPQRDQQPQGGGRHGAADDGDRPAGGLRARPPQGRDHAARARLDPAQPDVPADPDHHPALPAPARPEADGLARRPRARLHRLGAAVHPLDALHATSAGSRASSRRRRRVDGATRFQILTGIIAPLLLPGIVVTTLFAFITAWNEFFFALVILNSPDLTTLPLRLAQFVGIEGIVRLGPLAAAALLATLPSLLLFTIIQRWLTRGLLSGAVKG